MLLVLSTPALAQLDELNTYHDKAYFHYENQNYDSAAWWYTRAIVAAYKSLGTPKNIKAQLHLSRGVCHVMTQKYDRAMQDYDYALLFDPYYLDAYFEKAYLLFHQGELDKSEELYTKILSLDKTYTDALVNRGVIRYTKNRLEEAHQDWYTAAKHKNPKAKSYIEKYIKKK